MLSLVAAGTMASGAPNLMMGMVDVRDVAKAHVTAMTHPNAKASALYSQFGLA